jgi:hypothetical protein
MQYISAPHTVSRSDWNEAGIAGIEVCSVERDAAWRVHHAEVRAARSTSRNGDAKDGL